MLNVTRPVGRTFGASILKSFSVTFTVRAEGCAVARPVTPQPVKLKAPAQSKTAPDSIQHTFWRAVARHIGTESARRGPYLSYAMRAANSVSLRVSVQTGPCPKHATRGSS